jgi:rRNA-processing protein FCF1
MIRAQLPEAEGKRSLLVDSNLLVLYVVGSVNIARIMQFKRTTKYKPADYWLLTDVMREFAEICTVPQIMSEVSNLIDLPGRERIIAREALRLTIREVTESEISSAAASDHPLFANLGLTDAAIATAAKQNDSLVLTDDLPLYARLHATDVQALNYTHLRERFAII